MVLLPPVPLARKTSLTTPKRSGQPPGWPFWFMNLYAIHFQTPDGRWLHAGWGWGRNASVSGAARKVAISGGLGGANGAGVKRPISGDAVQTLYQLLHSGNRQYRGSLQLFASENSLGTRSCPQIFRPARFGYWTKWSFRSLKYRSITSLAASAEG